MTQKSFYKESNPCHNEVTGVASSKRAFLVSLFFIHNM